jgi:RNA polymerase-binding transcription factor DksA
MTTHAHIAPATPSVDLSADGPVDQSDQHSVTDPADRPFDGPADRPFDPPRGRRTTGPPANLVALPSRTDSEAAAPVEEIHSYLAQAEEARRRQLEALPEIDLDPVAAAYRGTVERILDEVRAARRRVEDDRYGVCTACTGTISAERLALRPWATACAACVSSERR